MGKGWAGARPGSQEAISGRGRRNVVQAERRGPSREGEAEGSGELRAGEAGLAGFQGRKLRVKQNW